MVTTSYQQHNADAEKVAHTDITDPSASKTVLLVKFSEAMRQREDCCLSFSRSTMSNSSGSVSLNGALSWRAHASLADEMEAFCDLAIEALARKRDLDEESIFEKVADRTL